MAGYNPATTDAWDLIKRRQQDEALATKEALRVGGTQPFQVKRKTAQSIVRIDEQQEDLEAQQAQLAEQQEQLAVIVSQLGDIVQAIPVNRKGEGTNGNWTPSGSWQEVAAVEVGRPDGKNNMEAQAIAVINAQLNSSEVILPLVKMRVVIDGDVGVEVDARGNFVVGDGSGSKVFVSGTALNVHVRSGSGNVRASVQVRFDWTIAPTQGYSWSGTLAQIALDASFTP